jgi:hypothetical protein
LQTFQQNRVHHPVIGKTDSGSCQQTADGEPARHAILPFNEEIGKERGYTPYQQTKRYSPNQQIAQYTWFYTVLAQSSNVFWIH